MPFVGKRRRLLGASHRPSQHSRRKSQHLRKLSAPVMTFYGKGGPVFSGG